MPRPPGQHAAAGGVVEAGVLAEEHQPLGADRAGAVLGDDHLGRALVGRLRVVDLVAVEEHHDVGVLLERCRDSRRSASIGRLSARASRFRLSWLRATIGTSSSRARIFRLRLISLTSSWRFSDVAAAAHQLQVVDHDQRQAAVLGLHPAGLGADLHHRDPRVVVEEQRHLEPADRPADLGPVGLAQPAGAQLRASRPWPRWTGCAGSARRGPSPARTPAPACPSCWATWVAMPEAERGLAHRRAGADDVQRATAAGPTAARRGRGSRWPCR